MLKNLSLPRWFLSLKEPIFIFSLTRLAIFLVTYYGVVLFSPGFLASHGHAFPENLLLDSWTKWDAGFYCGIAEHGYSLENAGIFPFYSFLIYIFRFVFKSSLLSGIIISNLSFLLATILLFKLVQEKFGEKIANRTVFYFCIFPTSFFFMSVLSEATFLCVSVTAFYFAEKDKWLWAGLFGMLSAMTRPIGIVLFIPLLWLYFEKRNFNFKKIDFSFFSLLLVPFGLVAFLFIIHPIFGMPPLSYMAAQGPWRRWLDFPWWDLFSTFQMLMSHQMSDVLMGKFPVLILFSFITVLLFIGLIPILFRKLPMAYALYALFSALFFLSFPSHVSHWGGYLQSNIRFIVPIFPYFIYFGLVGENESWNRFIIVLSLLFLSLFSIYNGLGGWLA